MLTTFVVYVDDRPGVLNRVASLFRRRAFNIESLTVGHTDKPGVSRMTIVIDTDELGGRRTGLARGQVAEQTPEFGAAARLVGAKLSRG